MRRIFSQVLLGALSATVTVAGVALVSPVLAATFVYVGNAESNDIYVLHCLLARDGLSAPPPSAYQIPLINSVSITNG